MSNKPKILVVEDDYDLLETYIDVLVDEAELVTFANPAEALEFYKTQPDFDLVITDQDLPDLKGSELVEEIKKINVKQKIVLITGFGFMVKFPPHYRVSVFPKPANIKKVVEASLLSAGKGIK